jgi:hypothetical protein
MPGCLLTAREDAIQGGSPSPFCDTGDAQDEQRSASTMTRPLTRRGMGGTLLRGIWALADDTGRGWQRRQPEPTIGPSVTSAPPDCLGRVSIVTSS